MPVMGAKRTERERESYRESYGESYREKVERSIDVEQGWAARPQIWCLTLPQMFVVTMQV